MLKTLQRSLRRCERDISHSASADPPAVVTASAQLSVGMPNTAMRPTISWTSIGSSATAARSDEADAEG